MWASICYKRFYIVVNQIPLWLITLFRPSNYHDILQNHFRIFTSSPDLQLPRNMEVDNLCLHYLDVLHHVLFLSHDPTKLQETDRWDLANNPNRPVTELVYKGVTFRVSTIGEPWRPPYWGRQGWLGRGGVDVHEPSSRRGSDDLFVDEGGRHGPYCMPEKAAAVPDSNFVGFF